MKTYKQTIVFCFICSLTFIHAQLIIDLPNVNTIIYDDNDNFEFYHKDEGNNYKYVDIYFSRKNNMLKYEIEISENTEPFRDIKQANDNYVTADAIKSTDINRLLQTNSYVFENPDYDDSEEPVLNVLENFSKDLISFSELHYKKRSSGGFGSYENLSDDEIEKWRVYDTKYYNKVIVNIADNKQIVIFIDNYADVETIFIPLKNESVVTFGDYDYKKTVNSKTNNYNEDSITKLGLFDYDGFYSLKKDTVSGGYKLLNNFGINVLETTYDTIQFNNYFVITKINNDYSIYKSDLKKMAIDNIKSAYLYKNGLDVLHGDITQYYDYKGQKIDKFNPVSYILCGTVSETNYELKTEMQKKFVHSVTISYGSALSVNSSTYYYIKNLTKKDSISFLDKSLTFNWDDNDSFVGSVYKFPNLLRVVKNNKVGIFSYKEDEATDLKIKSKRAYYVSVSGDSLLIEEPISLKQHKMISLKEELPVGFDDIEQCTKDGFIYIYKNNKVGIYPKHKTAIYDSIEYGSENFYKIIKNGKKGWLDVNTFESIF